MARSDYKILLVEDEDHMITTIEFLLDGQYEIRAARSVAEAGAMLQAVEQLNELGAGKKTILLFSDLKEEVKNGHVRDISIDFSGCRVVAINVIKLRSDNIDPREYYSRVEKWRERVEAGGGKWRVVNDLDRLDIILKD